MSLTFMGLRTASRRPTWQTSPWLAAAAELLVAPPAVQVDGSQVGVDPVPAWGRWALDLEDLQEASRALGRATLPALTTSETTVCASQSPLSRGAVATVVLEWLPEWEDLQAPADTVARAAALQAYRADPADAAAFPVARVHQVAEWDRTAAAAQRTT
jgi:hypothetical protein